MPTTTTRPGPKQSATARTGLISVSIIRQDLDTEVCSSCSKELDNDIASPPSRLEEKSSRSFEVERKRALKLPDRVKALDSKAAAQRCYCCHAYKLEPNSKFNFSGRPFTVPWEELKEETLLGKVIVDEPISSPVSPVLGPSVATNPIEVNFEELMHHSKVRKSKKPNGDFELVPPVRSVIVLEDQINAVPELDEDWEHISSEEESEGTRTPTYAQILAGRT